MTLPNNKKIFVGSFFHFSPTAQEELISSLQSNFSGSLDTPFISFEPKRNLLRLEGVNKDVIAQAIIKFKAFIDSRGIQANQVANLTEIHPLPGTELPTNSFSYFESNQECCMRSMRCVTDSEDSSDIYSLTDKETTYWRPQCGNIAILSRDIAESISNATGCLIFPQFNDKRVDIQNGNVSEALEKLERLESLLERLHRHRSGSSSSVDSNILFLSNSKFRAHVVFREIREDPTLHRVMADASLEPKIAQMHICKQLNYDVRSGHHFMHEDLDPAKLKSTKAFGRSKMLKRFETFSIGDEANRMPKLDDPVFFSVTSDNEPNFRSGPLLQHSKFLRSREVARLAEWTQGVDYDGDIDTVTRTPLDCDIAHEGQGVNEPIILRRIEEDSDSDLESKEPDESIQISVSAPKRLPDLDTGNQKPESVESCARKRSDEPLLSSSLRPHRSEKLSSVINPIVFECESGSVSSDTERTLDIKSSRMVYGETTVCDPRCDKSIATPQEHITQQPIQMVTERQQQYQNSNSAEPLHETAGKTAFYDYNSQLSAPRVDVGYARDQVVDKLLRRHEKTSKPFGSIETQKSLTSSQHKIQHDEPKSRGLNNSINERTPNLDKKRGSILAKQETKKQREERLAKIKADAYGGSFPSLTSTSTKMKRSTAVSSGIGVTGSAEVHLASYTKQVRKLASVLENIFKAARSYDGRLNFEIQFGQVLISAADDLYKGKYYDEKQWNMLYGDNQKAPHTSFTNILTNNGIDVDRLIEIKNSANESMWHSYEPAATEVFYEFLCQESSGTEFTIVMDAKGMHIVRKNRSVIGKIALHFPGQIWDGCAVLDGDHDWASIPDTISGLVNSFVSTVYIQHTRSVTVHCRLPANATFMVRSIIVRRSSCHDCLIRNHPDIQLRTTEIKSLYLKRHQRDSRLLCGFERNIEQMAEDLNIHFEVAIVNKQINKDLKAYPDSRLSNLASSTVPEKPILSIDSIQSLVEVTAHTIGQIGWVGGHNIGTMALQLRKLSERQHSITQSIASRALQPGTGRPVMHMPVLPSIVGRSGTHNEVIGPSSSMGTTVSNAVPQFIHGVRAGTEADLFRDSDGVLYRYGTGGARIPVVLERDDCVAGYDIVPDDSASQVAGNRTVSQIGPRRHDPYIKPEGFW